LNMHAHASAAVGSVREGVRAFCPPPSEVS
jgi:hypothetical protein